MANTLKCENCCYQWKDEDDRWPCCHWESRCPGDVPPCEEYDEDEPDDDYDHDYWDEFITEYEE